MKKNYSKEEFLAKMIEIEKKIDTSKWKFPNIPSLYEMGFLSSMIKGWYKNKSVDSFESRKDRRLFEKYNALTKEEQQEKYKQLQTQLNNSIKK